MSTGEQDRVYEAIAARGDTNGWTREQFAARQMAKLVQEIAELAEHVRGGSKEWEWMMMSLRNAGTYARWALADADAWRNARITDLGALVCELPDVQVPVFCLATTVRLDIVRAAVEKAEADVERGVR